MYRRIKDIPGSKTRPDRHGLGGGHGGSAADLACRGLSARPDAFIFAWSAGLVFVRTAFFDILDMQGDRLVGKETIPMLLGEKRSLRLLKGDAGRSSSSGCRW